MPAFRARLHAAALLGYVSVALLFAWPLPLHPAGALFGAPGGDTGVYVWNLWVFRYELVVNGRLPFFTDQILSATPAVPLTLHNYTTLANVLALPLQPLIGTVASFNILMLAFGVLSAYVMFLFLGEQVGDRAAAWLGGLLFGFSPFMIARQMAHVSLVQAAPLPAFALVLLRIGTNGPTVVRAIAAGAIVTWAYLSDPYYGVYCALMAAFFVAWQAVSVQFRNEPAPLSVRAGLDLALTMIAGVVLAILLRGGRFEVAGLRVSMTQLYTPMLLLTLVAIARAWVALGPRVALRLPVLTQLGGLWAIAAATCLVLMAPLLLALTRHLGEAQFISPRVWWRSSAPGVDLLAYGAPNPLGWLTAGLASGWLSRMPDGLQENVASIPWVAIGAIVVAVAIGAARLPRYWLAFTTLAAVTALGPFVHVAGWNTYVPTPWTLLRYLPVVGAARMPTRLTILVMLGIAVLFAYAVRALAQRTSRPLLTAAVLAGLLLVELYPGPRVLFPVQIPRFYAVLAADSRPVGVLHLPTGLRDGISSSGNFSAQAQFFQIFHGKRLIGGYLSRLPSHEVGRYRRIPLMDVLLDLSEGRPVEADRREAAARKAPEVTRRLGIGYVVVDVSRANAELISFATSALHLEKIDADGGQELYSVRNSE